MNDAVLADLVNRLRSLTGQPVPVTAPSLDQNDSAALPGIGTTAAAALTSSSTIGTAAGATAASPVITQPIRPEALLILQHSLRRHPAIQLLPHSHDECLPVLLHQLTEAAHCRVADETTADTAHDALGSTTHSTNDDERQTEEEGNDDTMGDNGLTNDVHRSGTTRPDVRQRAITWQGVDAEALITRVLTWINHTAQELAHERLRGVAAQPAHYYTHTERTLLDQLGVEELPDMQQHPHPEACPWNVLFTAMAAMTPAPVMTPFAFSSSSFAGASSVQEQLRVDASTDDSLHYAALDMHNANVAPAVRAELQRLREDAHNRTAWMSILHQLRHYAIALTRHIWQAALHYFPTAGALVCEYVRREWAEMRRRQYQPLRPGDDVALARASYKAQLRLLHVFFRHLPDCFCCELYTLFFDFVEEYVSPEAAALDRLYRICCLRRDVGSLPHSTELWLRYLAWRPNTAASLSSTVNHLSATATPVHSHAAMSVQEARRWREWRRRMYCRILRTPLYQLDVVRAQYEAFMVNEYRGGATRWGGPAQEEGMNTQQMERAYARARAGGQELLQRHSAIFALGAPFLWSSSTQATTAGAAQLKHADNPNSNAAGSTSLSSSGISAAPLRAPRVLPRCGEDGHAGIATERETTSMQQIESTQQADLELWVSWMAALEHIRPAQMRQSAAGRAAASASTPEEAEQKYRYAFFLRMRCAAFPTNVIAWMAYLDFVEGANSSPMHSSGSGASPLRTAVTTMLRHMPHSTTADLVAADVYVRRLGDGAAAGRRYYHALRRERAILLSVLRQCLTATTATDGLTNNDKIHNDGNASRNNTTVHDANTVTSVPAREGNGNDAEGLSARTTSVARTGLQRMVNVAVNWIRSTGRANTTLSSASSLSSPHHAALVARVLMHEMGFLSLTMRLTAQRLRREGPRRPTTNTATLTTAAAAAASEETEGASCDTRQSSSSTAAAKRTRRKSYNKATGDANTVLLYSDVASLLRPFHVWCHHWIALELTRHRRVATASAILVQWAEHIVTLMRAPAARRGSGAVNDLFWQSCDRLVSAGAAEAVMHAMTRIELSDETMCKVRDKNDTNHPIQRNDTEDNNGGEHTSTSNVKARESVRDVEAWQRVHYLAAQLRHRYGLPVILPQSGATPPRSSVHGGRDDENNTTARADGDAEEDDSSRNDAWRMLLPLPMQPFARKLLHPRATAMRYDSVLFRSRLSALSERYATHRFIYPCVDADEETHSDDEEREGDETESDEEPSEDREKIDHAHTKHRGNSSEADNHRIHKTERRALDTRTAPGSPSGTAHAIRYPDVTQHGWESADLAMSNSAMQNRMYYSQRRKQRPNHEVVAESLRRFSDMLASRANARMNSNLNNTVSHDNSHATHNKAGVHNTNNTQSTATAAVTDLAAQRHSRRALVTQSFRALSLAEVLAQHTNSADSAQSAIPRLDQLQNLIMNLPSVYEYTTAQTEESDVRLEWIMDTIVSMPTLSV